MQIVERIKALCKEKCTTMGTLEKELGLGNGSIRRWDDRTPGADKILIIANRLEVSTDYLLTGKENNIELSQNERELINIYRDTNDIGQPIIINNAKVTQNALPRTTNNNRELTSSTSMIG